MAVQAATYVTIKPSRTSLYALPNRRLTPQDQRRKPLQHQPDRRWTPLSHRHNLLHGCPRRPHRRCRRALRHHRCPVRRQVQQVYRYTRSSTQSLNCWRACSHPHSTPRSQNAAAPVHSPPRPSMSRRVQLTSQRLPGWHRPVISRRPHHNSPWFKTPSHSTGLSPAGYRTKSMHKSGGHHLPWHKSICALASRPYERAQALDGHSGCLEILMLLQFHQG